MIRTASFLAIAMMVTACTPPAADEARPASTQRIEDVARRGAQVMPFDLQKTRHVFNKTAAGGLQRVEVKDPNDAAQVKLIREHLAAVAAEFRQGRFEDPAQIHGQDMPGLRELGAAIPGQIQVELREHPLGGVIDFRSNDPALVASLHRWFDAQLSDHGSDAMSEHQRHGH